MFAPFPVSSDQLSEHGEQPQIALASLGQFKHHFLFRYAWCCLIVVCFQNSGRGWEGHGERGRLQVNVLRLKRVQGLQGPWHHFELF